MAIDNHPKPSPNCTVFKFICGAALAAVMVTVSYSLTEQPLDAWHVCSAAVAIVLFGLITNKFGSTFVETFAQLLANTGLY